MKKLRNFLPIVLSLLALPMAAQTAPELETYTLKNGLKVYLMPYGNVEAINIRLYVNTGKKNESPGDQGYSEITANALLMGNGHYDAEAQSNKAFQLGTKLRVASNNDYTVISEDILTQNLDAGFDLLTSAALTPIFPKEKLDQYISEQVAYRNFDKMDIAEQAGVVSNYFVHGSNNPLGRGVSKKQLKEVTPAKLKTFYDFTFTPQNSSLVICGFFDKEKVKQTVDKYFGNWKSAMGQSSSVSLEMPVVKKKEIAFVNRHRATQCALQWNKIAPPIKSKDAMALTIAIGIFNEALFHEIREKGGKTYGIYCNYVASQYSNTLRVACSVRSDEMYNTIVLFDKTLQDFSKNPISDEQFRDAMTQARVRARSLSYPSEVISFYNPLVYDFSKRKNYLADLDALTIKDVQKVIKKYFTPDIYKLVIAGDLDAVQDQLSKIPNLQKFSAADLEKEN